MPATYDRLASTTTTGSQTSLTFSSINQTYTDLVLTLNGTSAVSQTIGLRNNGDTGNSYTYQGLMNSGGSPVSYNGGASYVPIGGLASGWSTSSTAVGFLMVHIFSYAETDREKYHIVRDNAGPNENVGALIGFRNSNDAINSLTVVAGSGYNFDPGLQVTLYGIRRA